MICRVGGRPRMICRVGGCALRCTCAYEITTSCHLPPTPAPAYLAKPAEPFAARLHPPLGKKNVEVGALCP